MSELKFDEGKHLYSLDGVPLPSVTQVLKGVGIIDFSNVPPALLEAACQFGTAAHKATELSDKGKLDEENLDINLRPYLDGWILFRQEYGFLSDMIERPIYSKIYRFAGTPDRLGHWRIDDSMIILDIKTGFMLSSADAIQTAAYAIMAKEGGIKGTIKRVSLLLTKDGKYKIKEHKDKNDANVFISALSVYNWRRKHGN
jgi:hypothetical protein